MEHQNGIVCVIFCYFALLAGFNQAQTAGTECTSLSCTSQQGYISYPSSPYGLWLISKQPQQLTNITIYLKDIALIYETSWLRIVSWSPTAPPQTHIISTSEDRLLVLEASAVSIQLLFSRQSEIVQSFTINYYVGCAVLQGRSLSAFYNPNPLGRQVRTNFGASSEPETCWVVIPSIRVYTLTTLDFFTQRGITLPNYVRDTYMTIKNAAGINGSDITIKNLITDEILTEVSEDELLTSVRSKASNEVVKFNRRQYPSLFLVTFQCDNEDSCRQANFEFNSYGMNQEDLSCIEEQRCNHNLGVNCSNSIASRKTAIRRTPEQDNDLITTDCYAFNLLTSDLKRVFDLEEEDYEDEGDDDYVGPRLSKIPKKLLKRIEICNTIVHLFCPEEKKCRNITEVKKMKCVRLCNFYRTQQRGCSSGSTAIFS